ncbi:MAG: hypothetical protein RLZZ142_2584, partial [Verrucomicrobiota bacterium]
MEEGSAATSGSTSGGSLRRGEEEAPGGPAPARQEQRFTPPPTPPPPPPTPPAGSGKNRPPSLRSRILGILLISLLLPLALGIVAIDLTGYRKFRTSLGRLMESRTAVLALQLQETLEGQLHALEDWIHLSPALGILASEVGPLSHPLTPETLHAARRCEAGWRDLPPLSPEVLAILGHPISHHLREFAQRHPEFTFLELTDAHGRVLAATAKPEHFLATHAPWWEPAPTLPLPAPLAGVRIFSVESRDGFPCLHATAFLPPPSAPGDAPIARLHAILHLPNPIRFTLHEQDGFDAVLLIQEPSPSPSPPSGKPPLLFRGTPLQVLEPGIHSAALLHS